MEVTEDLFGPEVNASFTGIAVSQFEDGDALGPEKNSQAMIHSQTVTPPLAAIDGTTFRLKTATTKSRTRSKRPRTRFRCGWLASWVSADKSALLGPLPFTSRSLLF